MSRQYVEDSRTSVNGSGCAYASLSHYNNGAKSLGLPTAGQPSGHYVVPKFGAPGYDTLQHGSDVPSCSGYFNIANAYRKNAGQCNQQYMRKLCQ